MHRTRNRLETGTDVMFGLFMVWGAYCLFEIGNPNHVQAAWNIAITHYWVYPLVFAFVVPLAIRNYKGIEWLLLIWSVFVLIAAFKGYWQKSHGFNAKELYFLYTLGGYRTHLIWSGIRYFSCFPDAANFGVHSAMAVTTFGIATFYVRKRWMKVYFAIITICAIYGMGISGTRAAMAVPLAESHSSSLCPKAGKALLLVPWHLLQCFLSSTSLLSEMATNTFVKCVRPSGLPKMPLIRCGWKTVKR